MRVLHHLILIGLAVVWGAPSPARGADLSPEQVDALISAAPLAGVVFSPFAWDPDGSRWWDGHTASQSLHDACMAQALSRTQWDRLLHEAAIVRVRETWLVGHPLTIAVAYPRWAGEYGSVRIRPTQPWGDEARITPIYLTGLSDEFLRHSYAAISASTPRPTDAHAEFTIEVVVRTRFDEPGVFWSSKVSYPLKLVHDPAEIMSPIDTPDIEAAVRSSIQFTRFGPSGSPRLRLGVGIRRDDTCRPFIGMVAMPISIDVLDRAGAQVYSWQESLNYDADDSVFSRFPRTPRALFEIDRASDVSGWTVRVRGDGARAIHDMRFDSYWGGEYTIPLTDVLMAE